jgi:wobble nucleotide-excising tRNase
VILSLKLANVATYDVSGVQLSELKKINFIYGANGSGKTTASTYISQPDDDKYQNCQIVWGSERPLSSLVYNKAFRDKNFGSTDIAGVFTLGQATTEQIDAIKSKKSEQQNKTRDPTAASARKSTFVIDLSCSDDGHGVVYI